MVGCLPSCENLQFHERVFYFILFFFFLACIRVFYFCLAQLSLGSFIQEKISSSSVRPVLNTETQTARINGTKQAFAETNCRIAHNLGILLMNSNCFAISTNNTQQLPPCSYRCGQNCATYPYILFVLYKNSVFKNHEAQISEIDPPDNKFFYIHF